MIYCVSCQANYHKADDVFVSDCIFSPSGYFMPNHALMQNNLRACVTIDHITNSKLTFHVHIFVLFGKLLILSLFCLKLLRCSSAPLQ